MPNDASQGDPDRPAEGSAPADDHQSAASELRFLDAAALQFRREGSLLKMRQADEDGREVGLVRLFPLSDAEEWIAVVDEKGKELGVLRDLKALSAEDLDLLREELQRRYLVPQIRRILNCRDRFDLVEWTVETDRGEVTFLMRNERDQVKEPLPRRLSMTDVEGNRYDVPDLAALDPQSRRFLELRL